MLFIKSFNNYEEFQEIFGIRKFEERKVRSNKILLSLLKDKKLFHESVKNGDLSLFAIKNMVDLKNALLKKINTSGGRSKKLPYKLELLGNTYYSDKYSLDHLEGICEDGTPNAVRYINHENDRVFKMKCGKFMKQLIESTKFGKMLPESIIIWMSEEFNRDWQSYAIGRLPKNKLYVNRNFADIYDPQRLKGYDEPCDSFCSCMVGRFLHGFYEDSVKAKAAYLEDESGKIISRCVIFTEVYDEDGKKWRYAERQYSYKCNDVYKQALVDALIQAGEIDCYKKIGASCHDCRAIVDISGNSLAEKKFHIECNLDWEDTLSYQDTFKYYDMCNGKADNHGHGYYALDITEGSLADADQDSEPEEWDSYHQEYVYEAITVYYHGNEETCDSDNTGDFVWFNDDYYHEDDILTCPKCGKMMLNPEYYEGADNKFFHSDLTNEDYYCSEECKDEAEKEYKEKFMFYSDFDKEWYSNAEDLAVYHAYNCITLDYEVKTISHDSLTKLLERNEMFLFDNQYYDAIDYETGKPYCENCIEVTTI